MQLKLYCEKSITLSFRQNWEVERIESVDYHRGFFLIHLPVKLTLKVFILLKSQTKKFTLSL